MAEKQTPGGMNKERQAPPNTGGAFLATVAPAAGPSSGVPRTNEQKKEKKPTLIAVYNFKGGVGKTMSAVNLAATMAMAGKRVLIVDADPQANSSAFFLVPRAPTTDDDDKQDDGSRSDDDDDDSSMEVDAAAGVRVGRYIEQDPMPAGDDYNVERARVNNLWHFSNGLNNDDAADGDVNRRTTLTMAMDTYMAYGTMMLGVEAPRVVAVPHEALNGALPVGSPVRNRLFLLPGDAMLIKYERIWQQAQTEEVPTVRAMKLGVFRAVVVQAARANNIDMVIVDTGPSNGTLNKIIVTSCDFLWTPVFPESFSAVSLYGLMTVVLDSWFRWQAAEAQRQTANHLPPAVEQAMANFRVNPVTRVLPAVVVKYGMLARRIKRKEAAWIQVLEEIMSIPDIPQVVRDRQLAADLDGRAQFVVPLIKDANSTSMAVSHTLGWPLVMMRRMEDANDAVDQYKGKVSPQAVAVNLSKTLVKEADRLYLKLWSFHRYLEHIIAADA